MCLCELICDVHRWPGHLFFNAPSQINSLRVVPRAGLGQKIGPGILTRDRPTIIGKIIKPLNENKHCCDSDVHCSDGIYVSIYQSFVVRLR